MSMNRKIFRLDIFHLSRCKIVEKLKKTNDRHREKNILSDVSILSILIAISFNVKVKKVIFRDKFREKYVINVEFM